MANYLNSKNTVISGAALSPYPDYPAPYAVEQQYLAKAAQCSNLKEPDPGLSSEADQIASLSATLVSLVETVRGHLDPNFGIMGQAQSNAPAAPTHLRYQLSNAIGNTNHTIEQLRLILDIVSR